MRSERLNTRYCVVKGLSMRDDDPKLTLHNRDCLLRSCRHHSLSEIIYNKNLKRLERKPVWEPALTITIFDVVYTTHRGRQGSNARFLQGGPERFRPRVC